MEKRHRQVVRFALLVKTCHVKKSQTLVPISSKIAITLTRYLWRQYSSRLDKKQETLNHILKKTGLEHLKNRPLSNDSLSGGEKQRLEIARALYHDSQLILADEIKANLDLENSRKISNLLFSLPQTVIEVIHHYTEEDLKHYDQVIHLSKEK